MLQRKTEDGESVQVAGLGPSEYFGKLAYSVCLKYHIYSCGCGGVSSPNGTKLPLDISLKNH